MTFKDGPRLQFLFHSDSSNNEWGYKFTVTAYGLPDVAVSWGLDLQLLVSRLMGRLASQCMALKSVHRKSTALIPFHQNHVEEQAGALLGGPCIGTEQGTDNIDTGVRKFPDLGFSPHHGGGLESVCGG